METNNKPKRIRPWDENAKAWRKKWLESPRGLVYQERQKEARKKWFQQKGKAARRTQEFRIKRRMSRPKKSGLSVKEYDALFQEQKGCCAVCGRHRDEFRRPLSSDHNHKTGQIRNLLCDNCNFAVGHADESVERLEKLIAYLNKWNALKISG